jgi:voltage-gated potassium channel
MKNILRKVIIETDTKQGKVFEVSIQSLIILSLLSFSFETLPNLGEKYKVLLSSFKFICVVFFSIEYILRVWLTKPSKAYIFSFFGIIDLLAIIPFYLASGIDLRSIRIFRLIKILNFFKFNSAMDRLIEAFIAIKNELIIFGVGTIFLIYVLL